MRHKTILNGNLTVRCPHCGQHRTVTALTRSVLCGVCHKWYGIKPEFNTKKEFIQNGGLLPWE
jgi:uncharacterized protein (DUF983 family)